MSESDKIDPWKILADQPKGEASATESDEGEVEADTSSEPPGASVEASKTEIDEVQHSGSAGPKKAEHETGAQFLPFDQASPAEDEALVHEAASEKRDATSETEPLMAPPVVEPLRSELSRPEPKRAASRSTSPPPKPVPSQSKSSHWRQLATELGLEAPPEPDEPAEPIVADFDEPVTSPIESDLGEPVNVPDVHEYSAIGEPIDFGEATLIDVEDIEVIDEPETVDASLGETVDAESKDEAQPGRRRKRRRGRRRRRGQESEKQGDERAGERGETVIEDEGQAEASEELEEAAEAERPTTDERQGRRRRRRRRGSGRDRTDDAAAPSERDSSDDEADTTDIDDDTESDAEDNQGGAGSSGASGAKHRKIPTWQEAINVVISANMEGRSKSDDHSGRRGRGRGRN